MRHFDHWDFDSALPVGMTSAQAKAEVIERHLHQVKRARVLGWRTRRLRFADVVKH